MTATENKALGTDKAAFVNGHVALDPQMFHTEFEHLPLTQEDWKAFKDIEAALKQKESDRAQVKKI